MTKRSNKSNLRVSEGNHVFLEFVLRKRKRISSDNDFWGDFHVIPSEGLERVDG